jgi:hypothetical protein
MVEGLLLGIFHFPISGATYMGNLANKTAISGKVDIDLNNTIASFFTMNRIVNQMAGGIINAQNTIGFEVLNDTLLINSLTVSGYRGSNYGRLNNNKISGNLIIADDASYGGGFDTRISHNEIGGTATFTVNGTNTFYEANETNSQNIFTGNVTYTANNTCILNIGNTEKSTYVGNVTITRTVAGSTSLFGKGTTIAGNFSYTNATSGSTVLGNVAYKTAIAGTVNINISNTTTSGFGLYRIVNQTTGGSISATNTIGFDVLNDTLLVNSVTVSGYRGSNYGKFQNNKIAGNLIIADDASYGGGYDTRISHNEIGGTAAFAVNGTNTFYEADVANTLNTFVGNVSYTTNGSGALNIGNGSKSTYGGNVGITRTAAGSTGAFSAGATIAGNFLFSNATSGPTTLGNSSNKTAIGGKVDITQNNATTTSAFNLYRFVNQAVGGVIAVQNSLGFNVQNDTLVVNSLSITDYTGSAYGSFQNNKISGNVTIADHASYGGGYYTTIYNNEIGGTANFTNKGTNTLYDADVANTANKYLGDIIYTKTGGNISIAAGSENEYGKGIYLNSTSGISLNNIKFNGSSDGILEQLGTQPFIIPSIKLEKTGSGKITLNDSLTVGNTLALTSGRVVASLGNELIFPDNISYTGYSDASYVEGPIKKVGNDAFAFPLGGGGKVAKLLISPPVNISDVFSAEYINNTPINTITKEISIDHITQNEYWLLNRLVGNSDVALTLSWETARSGIVDNLANLLITNFTGGLWANKGNGSTTGTNLSGTIVSPLAMTTYGSFTLASVNATNSFLPIFESIITGNWNIGSTWIAPTNPVVPSAKKISKINTSHTVFIPNAGNQIRTVILNGGSINLTGGSLEIKNQ